MEKETVVALDPDDFRGRMCALTKMAGRYREMRGLIAMLLDDGETLPPKLVALFTKQQAEIDDDYGQSAEQQPERLAAMAKDARESFAWERF